MEMKSGIVEVRLHGEPVGVLVNGKNTGSATFRYYEDAPYDLSLSLPRSKKEFNVIETRNWFSGLLPDAEGERIEALSKHFVLSTKDYPGLLTEVGYDCAGAVTFGVVAEDDIKYTGISLAEVLPELPYVHMGASNDSLRSTLAGFQNKVAAVNTGAEFLIPDAGYLSTHIIKTDMNRWEGFVDAEAWAMTVAGAVTPAADTSIIEVEGTRALVSRRFDRFVYDGIAHAVHQEDFCQALGLNEEHRYAKVGGNKKMTPTYLKLATILRERSLKPELELEKLLRQMVVTLVLNNTDAHAKNFGLIHDVDSNVSLSPMYDVVPVTHFIPSDKTMGMTINSKFRLDRVRFLDLVLEAESWGVDHDTAASIVRQTVEEIADAIPVANAKYPGRPDGVFVKVRDMLRTFDITLNEDGTR